MKALIPNGPLRWALLLGLVVLGASASGAATCPPGNGWSNWASLDASSASNNSCSGGTGTLSYCGNSHIVNPGGAGQNYWESTYNPPQWGGGWTNADNNSNPKPTCGDTGCLDYVFTVSGAGWYNPHIYSSAPGNNDRNYFATLLNGLHSGTALVADCVGNDNNTGYGATRVARADTPNCNGWGCIAFGWSNLQDRNNNGQGRSDRRWYLTPGTYTLRLTGISTGTKIGKIFMAVRLDAPAVTFTSTPTPVVVFTNTRTPNWTATPPPTLTPTYTAGCASPSNFPSTTVQGTFTVMLASPTVPPTNTFTPTLSRTPTNTRTHTPAAPTRTFTLTPTPTGPAPTVTPIGFLKAGNTYYAKLVLPSGGNHDIYSIGAYLSGAGNYQFALYDDVSGSPVNMLGTGPTVAGVLNSVGSGLWVNLSYSAPVAIAGGTTVWVAFWADQNVITGWGAASATAAKYVTSKFPDPAPAATSFGYTLPSFYVRYCSTPYTPTPTPTPTPAFYAGLPDHLRLYGLEYIPFPETATASASVKALHDGFSTAVNNNVPRNTARWRIQLQNMNAVGQEIQVETRIGGSTAADECTSGYLDPSAYEGTGATSLVLPDRPTNLSTTYFWVNRLPPATEQFDAMGDARFTPYLDVLDLPNQLFAGGYNYYFRSLTGIAPYISFATRATFNKTDTFDDSGDTRYGANIDVPKLYRLWRDGVVRSGSIYNTITGWSNFYFGIGGEIGGDSNQLMSSGVKAWGGPWNNASTLGVDEIVGAAWGRPGSPTSENDSVLVRSSTNWVSMPWLGELYPDSAYKSEWKRNGSMAAGGWGNLRNTLSSGSWYRDQWSNCNFVNPSFTIGGITYSSPAFGFSKIRHAYGTGGATAFMNNSGTRYFQGSLGSDESVAAKTSAINMGNDFHAVVPDPIAANRPLAYTKTGAPTVSALSLPPYSAAANQVELALGGHESTASGKGYYATNSGSYDRESATLVARLGSDVGWFVVSGLAPAGQTGINFLARYAIMSSLRAFHDAGMPTINASGAPWVPGSTNAPFTVTSSTPNYRIPPVPLVEFTSPVNQDPTTSGRTSIPLTWRDRYVRWDNQPYTELYPCIDEITTIAYPAANTPCTPFNVSQPGNPSKEWHDTATLAFNLKYRSTLSSQWFSVFTNTSSTTGTLLTGPDVLNGNPSHINTYNWDVSTFAPGDYFLRIECYRTTIAQHYAYHEIRFRVAP